MGVVRSPVQRALLKEPIPPFPASTFQALCILHVIIHLILLANSAEQPQSGSDSPRSSQVPISVLQLNSRAKTTNRRARLDYSRLYEHGTDSLQPLATYLEYFHQRS
jgi:hypothetical protein